MKLITHSKLTKIGSAGLRCAHWCFAQEKRKKAFKNFKYLKGYHMGKFYAYMFVISQFNLVEIMEIKPILKPKSFLKTYYKGWINLFPNLKLNILFLMKEEFFEDCLNSYALENTYVLMKQIRKMCKKI